ncbi:hypothetical protein AGABI1DRAFT_111874 [Agaricus bisporus var. burnettii JB137-S8]|uniref:Uncharacterized protein n=1 Tax=Agaricus bisporus var. burnettii (strain JB137-S8 / ATCC MYA-4627 / FGSC 10392) TaxID=597362 RepID=K5W498_AGABU|nr:uncharacterized protein AGABI1DRAFT_111874 [Agaricus bisporus var. burnettii JB137-S8]EKM81589.1 hypothetical protein AGABI1DRAFT_111874 [Agaricus bisporus var. burnettii JB137-S8]
MDIFDVPPHRRTRDPERPTPHSLQLSTPVREVRSSNSALTDDSFGSLSASLSFKIDNLHNKT